MDMRLLGDFSGKPGASEAVIKQAEADLDWTLPAEYREFLRQMNGGEGFFGEDYLILWSADELAQFNREYEVENYAPGLVLFGSDGGGEGFAFDTRNSPAPIVQVPFIGMELQYANPVSSHFEEFIAKVAGKHDDL
jgi:hypothetical protein